MQTPKPVPPPSPEGDQKQRPRVQFDWRDWLLYVEASDAPEDKKRELIETLWVIVMTFVDHGWEVGDIADANKETCGKDIDLTAALKAAVLHSKNTQTETEEA